MMIPSSDVGRRLHPISAPRCTSASTYSHSFDLHVQSRLQSRPPTRVFVSLVVVENPSCCHVTLCAVPPLLLDRRRCRRRRCRRRRALDRHELEVRDGVHRRHRPALESIPSRVDPSVHSRLARVRTCRTFSARLEVPEQWGEGGRGVRDVRTAEMWGFESRQREGGKRWAAAWRVVGRPRGDTGRRARDVNQRERRRTLDTVPDPRVQ